MGSAGREGWMAASQNYDQTAQDSEMGEKSSHCMFKYIPTNTFVYVCDRSGWG